MAHSQARIVGLCCICQNAMIEADKNHCPSCKKDTVIIKPTHRYRNINATPVRISKPMYF